MTSELPINKSTEGSGDKISSQIAEEYTAIIDAEQSKQQQQLINDEYDAPIEVGYKTPDIISSKLKEKALKLARDRVLSKTRSKTKPIYGGQPAVTLQLLEIENELKAMDTEKDETSQPKPKPKSKSNLFTFNLGIILFIYILYLCIFTL